MVDAEVVVHGGVSLMVENVSVVSKGRFVINSYLLSSRICGFCFRVTILWTDGRMVGQMHGQMDGQSDRWSHGQMDRPS